MINKFYRNYIHINAIWNFFNKNNEIEPQPEEREFEYGYIITDSYIQILMDDVYKEQIENLYRLCNEGYLQHAEFVFYQIWNRICEKHADIPNIKDKNQSYLYVSSANDN